MKKDNLYKKAMDALNNQHDYVSLMADFYGNNSREYEEQLKLWSAMVDIVSEIFDKSYADVLHDTVWMKLD